MKKETYSSIKIEKNESNLKIQLARPEKRNALNPEMIFELTSVFTEINVDDQIRTITLEGNDLAFCSGADLEYMNNLSKFSWDQNYNDSKKLAELYYKIYCHNKPVIAVVKGPAIAGGCGLASVCDYIISTENGKFGYPEVKIGFVAAIVSVFLIRQIGERKARQLLLTGELLDPSSALSFGLINEISEAKKINERVDQIIRSFNSCAPGSLSATKKLFDTFNFTNLLEQIDLKAKQNADFRQTDYFSEGVTSFLEKRKPNWAN